MPKNFKQTVVIIFCISCLSGCTTLSAKTAQGTDHLSKGAKNFWTKLNDLDHWMRDHLW